VVEGIVDAERGLYVDTSAGQTWPLAEAMSDGRIVVERMSTTKSAAETQSIGVMTIRTRTDQCDDDTDETAAAARAGGGGGGDGGGGGGDGPGSSDETRTYAVSSVVDQVRRVGF